MKRSYLEHANITVSNLEAATQFFQTAFEDFEVRGGGNNGQYDWIHLGTPDFYLALNERSNFEGEEASYAKNGINHIGFVVDDVEALAKRMLAQGYERSYPHTKEEFRTRAYFYDQDKNEFEFVQYFSDDIEERNKY